MKPPRLKPAPPASRTKAAWRQALGGQARKAGHASEWIAALWLMLRGYQILGFRLKGRAGEIDILARRGRVLAVVEVKQRTSLAAALEAVSLDQRERLRRAGESLAARRRGMAGLAVRLDLIALAPGKFPRHSPDAWKGT